MAYNYIYEMYILFFFPFLSEFRVEVVFIYIYITIYTVYTFLYIYVRLCLQKHQIDKYI